jgi:hypothetical protein
MLLDGPHGITTEGGHHPLELLFQRRQLLLGHGGCVLYLVKLGFGDKVLAHQIALPLAFTLGESVIGLRQPDAGASLAVLGLQRGQLDSDRGALRPGPLDRHAEGLGIQAQQRLPSHHGIVFMHPDLTHRTGDLGAERRLGGFQVGILGVHVTAAMEVETDAGNGRQ